MDLKKLVTQQPFYISERKEFISCELRPIWRISLLLLILKMLGRGNKASRNKVQLANWAIKDSRHLDSYLQYCSNKNQRPFINLDPALDKAIDYALHSQLVTIGDDKITLTEQGVTAALKIEKQDVFQIEKEKFKKIKSQLSEDKVKKAFEGK